MRCPHCGINVGDPPFAGPLYCHCGYVVLNSDGDGFHRDTAREIAGFDVVGRFASAYYRWMTAGFPRRPLEQQKELKSLCKVCKHYASERDSCAKCGCTLATGKLVSKIAWATERCPVGKWEAEVGNNGEAEHSDERR